MNRTTRKSSVPRPFRAQAALAAALALTTFAPGAPEPSPTPVRWELNITPGPLRVGIVDVKDVGPRAFFYMPYKVVNNSGEDLYFAPAFEMTVKTATSSRPSTTDDKDLDDLIVRAGRGVPLDVYQTLIQRLANPFLEDQISMIGVLRQGEENAREGLVVWPADNLKVHEIVVYAIGFSGETRRVANPDAPPPGPGEQPDEVTLRKTLMLVHAASGELTDRGNTPIDRTVTRWIMR